MGTLAYGRHEWVELRPEFEPEVRRLLAEVFDDLQLISLYEPGLASAYLDAIEEPLARLQAIGLQLVGITRTGTMTAASGPMPWSQTDYIVAPPVCFFRVDEGLVHLLGVDCSNAARAATRGGGRLAWWASAEVLERSFEGAVPWCARCAAESVEVDADAT